ncbi:MAG: ATP-binding cassette domain-containing protein [Clostridiales bacterium]|nr:ATP-binding cassette domain-containing protein [Clostridiales bacterium]
MITIEHLKKTFKKNKVEAVKDVSLEVNDGEIFALLGPNGAGKTTTMRMLSTLLIPTSGKITYDGKDINEDLLAVRRRIAFLTNEIRLDGQFTPDELANYYGRLYEMEESQIKKNKEELFEYFGISEFSQRRYETFSTGMKQKTSLAICLLHDPDTIIFDEPTNGLDILTQQLIEKYILRLKQEGKCIILSTHILDLVSRLADRVGVIVDGRSVYCGNVSDLASSQNVSTIDEAFVKLYEENHVEQAIITKK